MAPRKQSKRYAVLTGKVSQLAKQIVSYWLFPITCAVDCCLRWCWGWILSWTRHELLFSELSPGCISFESFEMTNPVGV
jgi:hypothetical protein